MSESSVVNSVLARKWRPKTFAHLAGQEHVVRALSNALTQNRLHHAYLFTGTRGVGKTTIARIFAKSLNCVSGVTATPCGICTACTEIDSGRFIDLLELDAASNTQVDNMRELLESALYTPTSGRFKVYIIDEVHMLSKSAFNAMLKTLEEPPAHVKFILATTDPQKIPVTVLSRCLQFNLKQLPPTLIVNHLQYVLQQEHIVFETAALALLARAAQGSMRDALSLLDQAIAYSDSAVNEVTVRSMLGAVDQGYLYDLLESLLARDGAGLLHIADQMLSRSVAFDAALQDLATLLYRIAFAQTVPESIPEDEPERVRLLELAQHFSAEDVQLFYQIAIHGRNEIDLAPDEYAGFSMSLLRMLAFMPGGVGVPVGEAPTRPAITRPATTGQAPAGQPPAGQPPAGQPPAGQTLARKVVASAITSAPVSPQLSVTQPEIMPAPPAVSRVALDWGVLLAQLNVQGMARELAKHCTLENFAEGSMALNLSPQHKQLLENKVAQKKLESSLTDYFAQPLRLTISIGTGSAVTPAAVEQKVQQTRHQQATEAITQDPFVREAQALLGAQIIQETIKPIQQETAR